MSQRLRTISRADTEAGAAFRGAEAAAPSLAVLANRLAGSDAEVAVEDVLVAIAEAIGAGSGGAAIVRPKAEAGAGRGSAPAVEVLARTADPAGELEPRSAWLAKLAPLVPSLVGAGDISSVVPLRHPGALYGQSAAGYAVAVPVGAGPSRACAAFFAGDWERADAQAARERLDLCGAVLALAWARGHDAGERRRGRAVASALSVLSSVGSQASFRGAALALCDEVASRYFRGRGARVTLGVRRGRYVKALAMSRVEKLDRKMRLVGAIESAMEECLDQDLEVAYPVLCKNSAPRKVRWRRWFMCTHH